MAAPAHALAPAQAPSLYASLLGPGWEALPAIVRRLHQEGSFRGRFTIRRGRGALSSVLSWLSRFPAAGENVDTRLVVRRDGALQHWERSFGGHLLTSVQCAREGSLMAERFGPLECAFRLRPVEGGLTYEQVSAWFCLGPWRLPLPRMFAPRVECTATEAPGGMAVHVRIGSGFTDWLLVYEGIIQSGEEAP
ncbi:MAG TPA: DUF4166 domain-containing protein [Myxococcaceae bacterium]